MSRALLLDSFLLSNELSRQFSTHFLQDAFKYFALDAKWPALFEVKLGPELRCVGHLLLEWWHWKHLNCLNSGQHALQITFTGLHLSNYLVYLCLETIPVYLRERESFLRQIIPVPEKLDTCFSHLNLVLKFLKIINILRFLQEGLYPTLTTRILGLKPVIQRLNTTIDADSIGREMFWHSLLEVATSLVPLIKATGITRSLRQLIPASKSARERGFDPSRCSICGQPPIVPTSSVCSHIACYICISTQLAANDQFKCPDCQQVQDQSRLRTIKLYS